MKHFHAVVWVDHREAKIFSLNWHDAVSEWRIQEHSQPAHIHHKAGPVSGPGKAQADEHYFHEIGHALESAGEILICGPGTAKLELIRHLRHHDPAIEKKVVGVETVDHPTEGQLLAYARKTFKSIDASLPQGGGMKPKG